MLALVDGDRERAWPAARATCPQCAAPVIAKCGELVTWHWAHERRDDCDTWAEGESAWHLGWKGRFPAAWCEVVRGPHRADVALPDGRVLELQHSSLTPADVREREAFYGPGLVWLVDAAPFRDRVSFRRRDGFVSFRWWAPRKWLWATTRPVVWDLGVDTWAFGRRLWWGQEPQWIPVAGRGSLLFVVRKLHSETPCGGWGYFTRADAFVRRLTRAQRAA